MSDIQSSTFNGDGHFSGFPDSKAQTLTVEAMRQDLSTLNQLVMNETETVDDDTNIPQVHPILVVVIGTSQAELLPILDKQLEGMKDLAPWRGVVVDSLPYDDLATRLAQNGWTRDQVEKTIPRSHYLQLTSPFTKDFSFDHPLNQDWKRTIFEPGLERLAKNPDAPGCAGTPALARARVEGNTQDLRGFFQQHLQALTQVSPSTLALLPGVRVFIITTFRGGTGSGASTLAAALLRSVMADGEIHLITAMPCIYGEDDRAKANAFAALRETYHFHRYSGGVPIKGQDLLKAPFSTVNCVFASNGAVTLGPVDVLMQEAAVLRVHVQAHTQSTVNARAVDLTDVVPHDPRGLPMHIRVETATSIRTVWTGTQEYVAAKWLWHEVKGVQERFETWLKEETLTVDEESRLEAAVVTVITELNLSPDALLARIDPSPAPTNQLRSFFEQARGVLSSMKAGVIKQSMAGLPTQVRETFSKFEVSWEERTRKLAEALPREIGEYVVSKLTVSPHLALAALGKVRDHLAGIAKAAKKEAETEKNKRDAAGSHLGLALNEVKEASGILLSFKVDEVTRNAAYKALEVAMHAALARAQQHRFESLVLALEGEINSRDGRGKPITLPSVTASLRNIQTEQISKVRQDQKEKLEALQALLQDLGQKIEKRSEVFQRALLYDQMSREQLDAEVRQIRKRMPDALPVVRLLKGEQHLWQTLAALLQLLPSYAESCRTLEEILTKDLGKRKLAVQILRGLVPFTPIDREVEDQQGLRNRRDTVKILEVPGGQNGAIARLMMKEGIVTNRNHIVDSGEDEIRLYHLREGLPYAVILPLRQYKNLHDQYLARPDAITPYTVADAHQFPDIEPSRTNLRFHTERLIHETKAVLPEKLVQKPSGGFMLRYEQDTGHEGFTTTREESFPTAEALVGWLAKRFEILKTLETELQQHLDSDPESYKAMLLKAWQKTSGPEREHLQMTLFSLKVDPRKEASISKRSKEPSPKKRKGETL